MNGGNSTNLTTAGQVGRMFAYLWNTYITPLRGDVGSIASSLGGGFITGVEADDTNEGMTVTKAAATATAGEGE